MSLLRQAFVVCVTAVVVAFVIPAYLKPAYPVPEIFGTVAPGFEEVRDVFRQNYELGLDNSEAGSAFSVYKNGEKVVDLWAGYADAEAKRLWREDTMTVIFSSSKGLAAITIAVLADRGLIDFKEPVAKYWPEFAQNDKEKITVEQLLEHEAGLHYTDEALSYKIIADHKEVDRILAENRPAFEPGSMHAYHGITIGPYIDALVRRVDPKKRTVGQFFAEEVSQPFGIDAYIGLPLDKFHRGGRLTNVQATLLDFIMAILKSSFHRRAIMGNFIPDPSYEAGKAMMESSGDLVELGAFADPYKINIEVASANGIATAEALAKLFGILANGGKAGNNTLLSKRILDAYADDRRGPTPDLLMYDLPIRWKWAMDVIPQGTNAGNLFGAPGAGGQVAYADPNNKIGYGFVSRYMSPMGIQMMDPRFINLKESVLRAVKKVDDR
ncbi:beta-lactamase domain-containing protein 2-like [Apostichopus japonicus]|uniref:beta-lactamase domain-containing protein 2-like n=1 Tax=Stichopus japonicus TaxID=307972 RepID=UPI003AB868CA